MYFAIGIGLVVAGVGIGIAALFLGVRELNHTLNETDYQ